MQTGVLNSQMKDQTDDRSNKCGVEVEYGVYQEVGLLDSLLLPLQGLGCLTQRTPFSNGSSLMQLLLRYSNGTSESCILLHMIISSQAGRHSQACLAYAPLLQIRCGINNVLSPHAKHGTMLPQTVTVM